MLYLPLIHAKTIHIAMKTKTKTSAASLTCHRLLCLATLLLLWTPLLHAQGRSGTLKGQISLRGENATVSTLRPGELQALFPPELINDIMRVRIEGPIDAEDMKFLKRLATRGYVKNSKGRGQQTFLDLDLRHAQIVRDTPFGRNAPLESLPSSAFSSWNCLRSVVLPSHVRVISSYCFSSCSRLEMVEMPRHLQSIGQNAFHSCSKLKEAIIPIGVTELGSGCFSGCSKLANIMLPEGLTAIPDNALNGTAITNITIPSNVRQIGSEAFANTNLTYIEIPSNVQKLSADAFNGCQKLTAIAVHPANQAYADADGLLCDKELTTLICCPQGIKGELTLPASIINIGPGALSNCQGLNTVVLPTALRSIGNRAFSGCRSLRGVEMSASLEEIGNEAFANCRSLTSMALPQNLSRMGTALFSGCTALTDVQLPARLNRIPERTFKNCSSLRDIKLPQTVTAIDREAFYACKSLARIVLPEAVESFGKECFRKCETLLAFLFPPRTAEVGDRMLYDCDALREVVMPIAAPPQVKHVCDVKQAVLIVPVGAAAAYGKADGWKKFKTIRESE